MPQKAHFKFLAAGKPWFKQGYRYVYHRHYTSFSGKFKIKVYESSSLQPLTQPLTSQSNHVNKEVLCRKVLNGHRTVSVSPSTFPSIALTLWNLLSLLVSKACCNTRFATSFSYTSRVSSKWSHTRMARSPHISDERDDLAWLKGPEKWTHLGILYWLQNYNCLRTCSYFFIFQIRQEKKKILAD